MFLKDRSFSPVKSEDLSPMTFNSFFEGSQLNSETLLSGFDIETYSPHGFPHNMEDPVVNFSLAMPLKSFGNGLLIVSSICNPVFERELLATLNYLFKSLNGGTLLTYNGEKFDVQYVIERGKIYGINFKDAFSGLSHIDLYKLIRWFNVSLPKYNQKYVEKMIGVKRVINDVTGASYHFSFNNFRRGGDLKPVFYNIEDSVGCLRIAKWLSSHQKR